MRILLLLLLTGILLFVRKRHQRDQNNETNPIPYPPIEPITSSETPSGQSDLTSWQLSEKGRRSGGVAEIGAAKVVAQQSSGSSSGGGGRSNNSGGSSNDGSNSTSASVTFVWIHAHIGGINTCTARKRT